MPDHGLLYNFKSNGPMNTGHPIEKEPKTVPHDPRNEPVTPRKDDRPTEKGEQEARKEEGVGMKVKESEVPTELRQQDIIVNPTGDEHPEFDAVDAQL